MTAVVALAPCALIASRAVADTNPPAAAVAEGKPFVDPTATLAQRRAIELGDSVYVGPFAVLLAYRDAPIRVGGESNVQDNVRVIGTYLRSAADRQRIARSGLRATEGVTTGERVILAHGSSVRGPARLGVGPDVSGEDSGVFVSFGAQVDGAVIERDSGLSALSRVGPGIRLRSGFIVLPGKNVTTQAQADDPALGKVRPIVEADREFNAGVVEVNVDLAREYNELAEDDPSAVRGINVDPGGNVFDQTRDAPTFESSRCTGPATVDPGNRNRIIGNACFEDSLAGVNRKLGSRVSLRADEGGPFNVGIINRMGNGTIFHALEGNDLTVGNRVTYGAGSIVHGGGRPTVNPNTGLADPTIIGNDVTLGAQSIVFRSLVRNDAVIGSRSAVVGSDLEIGQQIPPRTIYANDAVFGPVEW